MPAQRRGHVLLAEEVEEVIEIIARRLARRDACRIEPGLRLAEGDEIVRNRLNDVALALQSPT